MQTSNYLNLITSQHYDKANFKLYNKVMLDMICAGANTLESMIDKFYLDKATGDQLDTAGILLSTNRALPTQSSILPQVLPDDLYRLVLKAKVMQKSWDGTIEGIYNITKAIMPDASVWLYDNQDMSMTVYVISETITDEIAELFLKGYIIPKPSSVRLNLEILKEAFFGYDEETRLVDGYDKGRWK